MAENSKKPDNKTPSEETQQPKRCFVIMPFSDPEGYAPGHFRKVYEQIIKPAVENAGYKAYRVDENGVSDLITTKIFKAILDCDMAVCDLSSRNPNVLYELGIRHAFDKPVVLIKDNKTDRIFDIQGISTVEYRRERLYDEVIEDQKKISEAITANKNNSSGYSILNMINLQKATYDSSIKDPDSPEINNALFMRLLNALEKNEQNQNNFDKPPQQLKIFTLKEFLEKEIAGYEFRFQRLRNSVAVCDKESISIEELTLIENNIQILSEEIFEFKQLYSITDDQRMSLETYLGKLKLMTKKIQNLKENK